MSRSAKSMVPRPMQINNMYGKKKQKKTVPQVVSKAPQVVSKPPQTIKPAPSPLSSAPAIVKPTNVQIPSLADIRKSYQEKVEAMKEAEKMKEASKPIPDNTISVVPIVESGNVLTWTIAPPAVPSNEELAEMSKFKLQETCETLGIAYKRTENKSALIEKIKSKREPSKTI